jgi:hypothetical protein
VTHFKNKLYLVQTEVFIVLHALYMSQITLLYMYVHMYVYTCIYTSAYICRGRDGSVGIVTHYGLDGPGIESRCGLDLLHPATPALRPTQPPTQWVPGHSQGQSAWA